MLNNYLWYRRLRGGFWHLGYTGWRKVTIDEHVHYSGYVYEWEDHTDNYFSTEYCAEKYNGTYISKEDKQDE